MDWRLQPNPVWPWPATLLLAAGLFAFSWWSYPPNAPRRRLLLSLRLLAIFIALFAFARPVLELTKPEELSSTLVLLYDKSRSMNLQDMWRGQSRWKVLCDVRKEAEPALKDLTQKVTIREYVFDRKLNDVADADFEKEPEGRQTAIGDALADVVQRLGDERIAGVLLLTDGVTTTGLSTAEVRRELAGRNVPVYSFGFGSETSTDSVRDIAPLKLDVPAVGFKKNRMPVKAEFSMAGFGSSRVPVRLLFDGEEKGRGELKANGDGLRGSVELTGIPDKAGDVKVTIAADPQPGELLPNNNAISTYVTVRADGLSVLHLEGKYRFWEPRFLRRSIDQSPDIDLTQVFLLDTAGKASELPEDLFNPGKFDVVIIGDLSATRVPVEQQMKLLRLIRSGSGLMMMGGYESFGPGGWGQTPLAEFLPVDMRAADPQLEGELKFTPTPAGLRHFILRLANDPFVNGRIWERLRPLDGGNSWAGLKPNSLVLAESQEHVPLLVAQEVGKTRSLAFANDTTWRWAMKNAEGKTAHARFWRQLMLWLAHREETTGNQVRIRLERRRVGIGERLPVQVTIESPDGKIPAGLQLTATIKAEDKFTPVTLSRQGDVFRASIPGADVPGDNEIRVVAKVGNAEVGSATAKYVVYDEDAELLQLAADHDSLRKLSEDTRGEFHKPEEFEKFVRSLKARDLNQIKPTSHSEKLWDRWEPLALFIAVVGLEWFFRKRTGLV